MSTRIRSPSTSERSDEELDADEVFDDVVWEHREVCNSCFAVIRDVDEYEADYFQGAVLPEAESDPAGDGFIGQGADDHGPYNELTTYPGRVFCALVDEPARRAPPGGRRRRRRARSQGSRA